MTVPATTLLLRRRYLPVPLKLAICLLLAAAWLTLSLILAWPWLQDLARWVGWPGAWFAVTGLALIPGFANAFLVSALLFDRRPRFVIPERPPPVSVLIAAYNEEDCICDTLKSFADKPYPAALEILVIDDGSKDRTREVVRNFMATTRLPATLTLRLLEMPVNGGKARALNYGLAQARHDYIITVDADTLLYRDALLRLVANQIGSPPNTGATAGSVLVRNSRKNFITRIQEWDYFLGIAVVKRIQSLLQGTLVAQGAFSIYRKDVLIEAGGWSETMGEDIVLTWAILKNGHRVGYAEDAIVFTNVPETYGAYYRQRKRWSRGMIEAFKRYPKVLTTPRLNLPFIYLNLAFPYLDFVYLFIFIPGVIAALFFQSYVVVGLMTLLLLPLAILCNTVMYTKQRRIFQEHGLRVRHNLGGLVFFTLAYQLVMAPASLMGYLSECINLRKSW